MDKYESICKLSKYSEIFHKFDKYDLCILIFILYFPVYTFLYTFQSYCLEMFKEKI